MQVPIAPSRGALARRENITHEASMFSVCGGAQIADDFDDEIVQRFGG